MPSRSRIALVLSLFLLVSAVFTAFAPLASADVKNSGTGTWRVVFDASTMEVAPTPTFELQSQSFGIPAGGPFHLGDLNDFFTVRLCNDDAAATNVQMTMTLPDSVISAFRSGVDNTHTETIANVGSNAGAVIPGFCPPGDRADFSWRVNLSTSGAIGPHLLNWSMSWTRGAATGTATGQFAIDVLSVFDPTVTPTGHNFPGLVASNGLAGAFPIQQNQQLASFGAGLTNQLETSIGTPTVTLGRFSVGGVSASNGVTSFNLGTMTAGTTVSPQVRLNVAGGPSLVAGTYNALVTDSYNRTVSPSGDPQNPVVERITETGIESTFSIAPTPILTAKLVGPTQLATNQFTQTTVQFVNTGNVALQGVNVTPTPLPGAGSFWFAGMGHYEGGAATAPPALYIGTLAPGASSAPEAVNLSHRLQMPPGTQRLPFGWNGWEYFAGANETTTTSQEVGVQWIPGVGAGAPQVGQLYSDQDNNGQFNSPPDFVLSASPWPAAFVDIPVTEPGGPSLLVTAGTIGTAHTTSVLVPLTFRNNEKIPIGDIDPSLMVGPGTPFLAPGASSATLVHPTIAPGSAVAPFSLAPGAVATVTFLVNLNTAWWQSGSVGPGTFLAMVMVNSTDTDSGVRTVSQGIPVNIEFVGFGPNLLPTATTNSNIVPGQPFTMNITINNSGDDVARNIEVAITAPAETLDLLNNFFNPGRNVSLHMSDFGAADFNDMVLAQAQAQRALSSPTPKVVHIHIDRLGPGQSETVEFTFVADSNLIPGVTYMENLVMTYSGSQVPGPFTKGPLSVVLQPLHGSGVVLSGETQSGFRLPVPGPSVPLELGAAAVAAIGLGLVARSRRDRRGRA